MIRRPPRSTQSRSSAASDVYKRQPLSPDDGEVAARAIGIENTGRVRKSAWWRRRGWINRTCSGRAEQYLDGPVERYRDRRQALADEELDFVPGQLFGLDDHIMHRSGALGNLPRIGPQQLVVEATADKDKVALGAAVLHCIGDRSLDVDLGQYLDVIGI